MADLGIKDLFKEVTDVTIDQRINMLKERRLSDGDIADIVNGVAFNTNPSKDIFYDVVIKSKSINEESYFNTFCENLGKIFHEASLQSKMDDILNNLKEARSSRVFLGANFKEVFDPTDSAKKNQSTLFKTIYENINDKSKRERIVTEIDKNVLIDFIDNLDEKNVLDVSFASEILKTNSLNAEIKNNIISREISFFLKVVRCNKGYADSLFSDDAFKNDFVSKVMGDANLANFITKLPDEVTKKIITDHTDFFKRLFNEKLNSEQKGIIFEKFRNNNIVKELVTKLNKETKKEVFKTLEKPTHEKVKEKIDATTENINELKNDFNKLKKNRWLNRGARIVRRKDKIIASILQFRVNEKEHLLARLAKIPTLGEDRLGLISRVGLSLYNWHVKAYDNLYDKLSNRLEKIDDIDENIERRINENIEAKHDIEVRKAVINNLAQVGKARRKNIKDMNALKKSIGGVAPVRKDKVGKLYKASKEIEALAWRYVLGDPSTTKSEADIKTIITRNKSMIKDDLTEKQISDLALQMYAKLEALKATYDDEELNEEQEQLLHMGMSNYVIIFAVTAITITGLIILLTTILS